MGKTASASGGVRQAGEPRRRKDSRRCCGIRQWKEAADIRVPEEGRVGKALGRQYEFISIMEIGELAVEYKGYDHDNVRYVDIKVLREKAGVDKDFHTRFREDNEAIRVLDHPNIRGVYDVVVAGSTEFVVMEHLEGLRLDRILRQKGSLSWRRALNFTIQIAKGLSHAHSKGVFHMDVNPQGIVLLRDGTVKISDFGAARMDGIYPGDDGNGLSVDPYLSPEEEIGEVTDGRSDIYSLGVVLYEMLTGQLPFEEESGDPDSTYLSVRPVAPSVLKPDVPPELEEITMKAIRQNPTSRYSSAEELVAALEQFDRKQKETGGSALAVNHTRKVDGVHVVYKDVPRLSRTGELSKSAFARRRSREKRISGFLGVGLVLIFIMGLFSFVWSDWLKDVFSDAERMDIPDFVGMAAENVVGNEALTDLFNFTVVYQSNSGYEEGLIIDQDPSAGSSLMILSEGIDIELTVSTGFQYLEVPILTHYPYSAAVMQLQSMGLVANIVMKSDEEVALNYVISTEPVAGAYVSSGDIVTLYVSSGPAAYVTMPDLIGMTQAEAVAELSELGLVCSENNITYVESDDEEEGLVVWQEYDANEAVEEGTSVNIEVGMAPSETETP